MLRKHVKLHASVSRLFWVLPNFTSVSIFSNRTQKIVSFLFHEILWSVKGITLNSYCDTYQNKNRMTGKVRINSQGIDSTCIRNFVWVWNAEETCWIACECSSPFRGSPKLHKCFRKIYILLTEYRKLFHFCLFLFFLWWVTEGNWIGSFNKARGSLS